MSNKLKTVRKGYPVNLFFGGGDANTWKNLASLDYYKKFGINLQDLAPEGLQLIILEYMNSKGGLFGLSKKNNLFSQGNMGTTAAVGGMALGVADKFLNKGAHNVAGDVLNTAGDVMMSIPGLLGYGLAAKGVGLIANGFTNKTNHAAMNAKKQEFGNYAFLNINANNTTDIASAYRGIDSLDVGSKKDYTSKGFLAGSGKSNRNYQEIKDTAATAQDTFLNNLLGTAANINFNNTMKQYAKLAALGGDLNTLEGVDPSTAIGYALYQLALGNKKDSGATNILAGTPNTFEDGGEKSVSKEILNGWYNNLIKAPLQAIGLIRNGGYHGGTWNGAGIEGHWTAPEYYYNDIYPADTLLVPVLQTFNDAFAEARRRGLSTFQFNGGTYGTELGDNPKWKTAGDARVQETIAPVIIPADTVRRRSSVPREDVVHPSRILQRGLGGTLFEDGGNILTHGAIFPTGATHINAGGTHEENPNEGVLVGVDQEGTPNLVEEGEVIWNDYVFSNRLEVPEYKKDDDSQEAKSFRRFSGKTFAEAAKKIEKRMGADERIDTITQDGLNAELELLAQVQEKEREKEKLEEQKEAIDLMSPEEFAALLEQQLQEQIQQEHALLQQQLAEQLAQLQQIAQLQQLALEQVALEQLVAQVGTEPPIMANGGKLNKFYTGGNTVTDDDLASIVNSNNAAILQMILEEYALELLGPELEVVNWYNTNKDNKISQLQWEDLPEAKRNRIIKLYRASLKKADRLKFDLRLQEFTAKKELDAKITDYRKAQENSNLTLDDISNLSYNDKVRLAKYINPDYKELDLSKLSENERAQADIKLNDDLVKMSKDKNITLGNLSKAFNNPLYHKDWKPVDAELAWKETLGYDWNNPLYGGAHDVVAGNVEGKYLPRSWTDNEGNIVINNGDNTLTYKNMEDYELSDDYLKPRYELAKSAAAQDEAGRLLWNAYTGTLNTGYLNSYIPTNVFGKDYANNLQSYDAFKNYILNNYDALNKAGSGFFDLKAGLMHGLILPTVNRNRELYQISGNEGQYLTPEGNWQQYYSDSITDDGKGTLIHTLTPREGISFTRMKGYPEGVTINDDGTVVDTTTGTITDTFPKAPNWPYLVGAGLQLGTLGYNLLAPRDYSNANAMIAAAKEAGNYMPIGALYAGQELPYRPAADTLWGKLQALTQGNARNIINNSSGNIGATIAGLNSNTYNGNLAMGEADLKWRQSNWSLLKDVQSFGLQRDTSNYDRLLKADMANQDALNRAKYYRMEGLKSGYAMRQAIDDARASAINAGINGLANLAWNYGLNKYNLNVIKWQLEHNQYPISQMEDGTWRLKPGYKADASGSIYVAKGGKIRRKKKGLSF